MRNAITFDSQVTLYESHAVDVIYEFGVDEALLILNDAIYQLSFGTNDILAYVTKPAYAASSGSVNAFLKNLVKEYLSYVNVSRRISLLDRRCFMSQRAVLNLLLLMVADLNAF